MSPIEITRLDPPCTITLGDKAYTESGAAAVRLLDDSGALIKEYVIGYLQLPNLGEITGTYGTLSNWHGTLSLGRAVVTKKWRLPQSLSAHILQIEVRMLDGRIFQGRTTGHGMVARLFPKKRNKSHWF